MMNLYWNMPQVYQGAADLVYSVLPVILLFLGIILAFVFIVGIRNILTR